jgi:hypothetical protein
MNMNINTETYNAFNIFVLDCYPVLLDGRHMGYVLSSVAKIVEQKLRVMKVKGLNRVSIHNLEG